MNCFALNGGRCQATIMRKCDGCSFCKTSAELTAGREYGVQRLKRLGKWYYYKGIYGLSDTGAPAPPRR